MRTLDDMQNYLFIYLFIYLLVYLFIDIKEIENMHRVSIEF